MDKGAAPNSTTRFKPKLRLPYKEIFLDCEIWVIREGMTVPVKIIVVQRTALLVPHTLYSTISNKRGLSQNAKPS